MCFYCIIASYNIIIVESVGLGQSEVDIDMAVDILVVLMVSKNAELSIEC